MSYDWNSSMAGVSGLGSGLMGSWFNPQQMGAATMPSGAGATSPPMSAADFSWASPAASYGASFGSGMGGGLMGGIGTTGMTPPADSGGGFMNMIRGQKGVAGDGITGWLGNGQNLSAAVQGISALSGAWLGYQQMKVAKDQLNFQKEAWSKNFANSTKTYNTSLEDRIRGRTADYAGKEADVNAYLDKNRLKT